MVLDVNSQHDIGTARAALEGREEIEAFRRDLAGDLKHEAYELIKTYDAVNKRKPPLLLSVRNTSQAFGFRLVWVEMSSFTRQVQGRSRGSPRRSRSTRIRSTRSGSKVYDDPLRGAFWDIEQRAVSLRRRVSFWRSTFTEMEYLIAHGGEVAP